MQRLEVSVAVRPIYGSLSVKRLNVVRRKKVSFPNITEPHPQAIHAIS